MNDMTPYYTRELFDFLAELAANNGRPWFEANRPRYERLRGLWLDDLGRLCRQMSQWEPAMAAVDPRRLAYRIYRDTRFSPDKTPYKTYFSALLSPFGRKTERAAYYLQMGADLHSDPASDYGTGLYGGLWCPDAQMLRKLRHAMADNYDELTAIVTSPDMTRDWPGWCGRALKTAPKGWPKDHEAIDVLRLCDIGKQHPLTKEFFYSPDWPVEAARLFGELKPLIDFLNYSIDEE